MLVFIEKGWGEKWGGGGGRGEKIIDSPVYIYGPRVYIILKRGFYFLQNMRNAWPVQARSQGVRMVQLNPLIFVKKIFF